MGQITDNQEYGRVMEDFETSTDVISEKYGIEDHFVRTRSGRLLRMRNTRARLHERSRQKRQVLQDMARPLKQWLIRHRNNPYPTKSEKVALALGSQMTLVQVSNWFANARRRLKNTVRDPDMTWGQRIRLYNSYVSGNAEPLSISSDDSVWDSGDEHSCVTECPQYHTQLDEHSYSATEPSQQTESNNRKRKSSESDDEQPQKKIKLWIQEDEVSPKEPVPAKYKSTIIQRYLNDSFKQLEKKLEREKVKSPLEGKSGAAEKQRQEYGVNWSELDAAEALTSLAGNKKESLT